MGYGAFVAGNMIGIGFFVGPIVAGYVFARSIQYRTLQRGNLLVKGALSGALVSPPSMLFIMIVVGFLIAVGGGYTVVAILLLAVVLVVSAALGGFGAWLATLGSHQNREPERWEPIESDDPWTSKRPSQR